MSEYIQNLNPTQRDAAVNYQGASLIIAGAGSGKTRVLTCRIAYMLSQGVQAHTVLALTFTNKAAKEMRERIATLVPGGMSRSLWMGTFHSVFARILRAESDKLGYPSSFTIYDSADAKNLVKLAIKELNLSDETYKPNVVAARISKAKNNLVTPQAYEANSSLQAEDREQRIPQFLDIYKLYARKCRENGAMDFDDLLLNTNILMRDFPEVLTKYQNQFRYILVDEYQDTNFAQYVIIRRLGELHGNVCVVGDDAQSIYSFRGAKIENILRFQQDFPGAKLFKLEQNYRSTQTIVNAANCVIEKNQRQIRKKSFSAADEGDPIRVIKAYTDKEESALLASDIYTTVRTRGVQYSDVAVLYRTNAQSRALEEALRSRNIPYKIYGGMSFYQRKEIKDMLAYVRLVVNPRDDEALRRIINTPARGIGDVTIGRIAGAAAANGLSMWEAVSTLDPAAIGLAGAAGNKVAQFAKMIGELSEMRSTTEAYTLGLEIATRSGLIGTYKMQQTPESISALENIEELLNSIRVYTEEQERMAADTATEGESAPQALVQIDEWLQNVALLTDMDNENPEERNKVTLMTVHSAKGLEFEYVYVAGLEENLFPSMMSMGTPEGLEEERRLFYVALTRAKRAAVLSFAESRFKWGEMTFGRPSRFLSEIDPQYLDLQFELGDSRGGELRAAVRPGGRPFALRTPRYGLFAGLRTGRLQEKSGCTGYRRAATHRHALARRTFPQPQRPGRHAGLSGNRIASIEILSPGNRPPGCPTFRSPRRISAPAYRRCDIRLPTCYRRHERLRPSRRILLAGFRRNGRRHTGRARQVRRGRDRRDRRVDQRRKADGGFRRGRQESAPKEVRQTANPLIRRLTATRRRRPALPAPGPATPPHSGRHDKPQQPIFRPICKESSGFCFSTCSAASSRR